MMAILCSDGLKKLVIPELDHMTLHCLSAPASLLLGWRSPDWKEVPMEKSTEQRCEQRQLSNENENENEQ